MTEDCTPDGRYSENQECWPGRRIRKAEARYDDDGSLDEVVTGSIASFHLEQLDDGVWWIGIEHHDGTTDHIRLFTKRGAKIAALYEANV